MAETLEPKVPETRLAEPKVPASKLPAGRIAFTHPDFTIYQAARFFIVAALEMQSVAVGWQVYEITKRPLDLGLIGLAQFLPGMLLFLVSGHVADRFDRRKLVTLCYCGFALSSGLLWTITWQAGRSVHLIYAVVVLVGVVRAFNAPVSRALLPQLVSEEHFPNAVAWNASIFQGATILGPSIGGFLYAFSRGPSMVYATAMVTAIAAVFSTLRIKLQTQARPREPVTWTTVLAGFHYIWTHKLVLGAISLDMFAVLLGGAVALLPVYASEILKTGPWGLGLLRSAPGAGAIVMAIVMAHRPLRRRAGIAMLWSVASFGALMIFFGVSNELGEFESGLTAHWFGTVPAVVLGGVGTLIVIAIWAWAFPELRNADQITG